VRGASLARKIVFNAATNLRNADLTAAISSALLWIRSAMLSSQGHR